MVTKTERLLLESLQIILKDISKRRGSPVEEQADVKQFAISQFLNLLKKGIRSKMITKEIIIANNPDNMQEAIKEYEGGKDVLA